MSYQEILKQPEYSFLKENPHLGNNICLLGMGGSIAYGTNLPTSDVDIRGIAVNTKADLLGMSNFEQVLDSPTDTCIYSMNKIFKLLLNCNPNCIELLGLKPEHYLFVDAIGQLILDNRKLFLSKIAIHSFGGYSQSQLRRMCNKTARKIGRAHV